MTRGESRGASLLPQGAHPVEGRRIFSPSGCASCKGVVDSEDLPLNISRETMQDSALLRKLNEVLTKRVLKWLDEEAKADPEKYAEFFARARPLPEGRRRHRLDAPRGAREAAALRVVAHRNGQATSLADYVSRMPEEQKEIYYPARAEPRSRRGQPVLRSLPREEMGGALPHAIRTTNS